MEILEAFDLTNSMREAARLSGCSHHTVARLVAERDAGGLVGPRLVRPMLIDEFLPKIEEWVEWSRGRIRADIAHRKLEGLGYLGSERTTRRAVHAAKLAWRAGRVRVHRPWVTEPGMWLQYDFGDGPMVGGQPTTLFCAWLAWSRFRVVLPIRDKTLPSVFTALDVTLRRLGGVPTYLLTDNEKTVTVSHVAGVPVRNQHTVDFARHYGLTVHTCVPYDPASKGGSENCVKLAKADLVPTDANLRGGYQLFTELEQACALMCDTVNNRVHRVTRRVPGQMLIEERARLHPLPAVAHTSALGVTRIVPDNAPMVTFENGQYSVPSTLAGQPVWVRTHGRGAEEQIVFVHVAAQGPTEVARHLRAAPGSPRVDDRHFPPAPVGALGRLPRAGTPAETAFLSLGGGAALWLTEAAAAGTTRMRIKMEQAVSLAKLGDPVAVDAALGNAATNQRFAEGDLLSIMTHRAQTAADERTLARASETRSLTQGTSRWADYGQPAHGPSVDPGDPPSPGAAGAGGASSPACGPDDGLVA